MKICILTHTFPKYKGDSTAPFMGSVAQALGELGHEVYVLTPYDESMKTKNRGPYKIITYKYIYPDRFHKLGYSRTFKKEKNIKFSTYFLAPFMYLFGFFALWRLVKEKKIDVVNTHWAVPNGFLAYLIKMITRVSYTTTIPGSDVHIGSKNAIFRLMVGFAVNGADYVISDSQHYIDQLNELGFYPEKVDIIRYGVNAKEFRPTAKDKKILESLGLNSKDLIILCVGRLVEKKGFIYPVRAVPLILKEVPKAKLVVVGDGYERKHLEDEVNKLNIKDSVIFAGTIPYDELSKYYNIADVFVVPSVKDEKGNLDASPVTMMEAMCCGTPVVATGYAGSEDIIVNGKTGYLVKERDSEEIAEAVVSLISINSKRTTQVVRKVALDNFSSKAVAESYEEIFKLVVD